MKKTSKTVKPICERCGNESHHLHHKDGNHKNNDPENHEHLCTLCHAKEHGIDPKFSELRRILVNYVKVQKMRISLKNAILGYERIELEIPDEIQKMAVAIEKHEKLKEKELIAFFKREPSDLYKWMVSIKGIGDVLAAKILANFDITKTETEYQLWSYAGYAPGNKKVKGKKSNWNQDLKTYCYQLSDSFIKQRTPRYREVYDRYKEKQLANGLKKGHADARARRKIIKLFLRDMFEESRKETLKEMP